MAEVRMNLAGDTDWRSTVKKGRAGVPPKDPAIKRNAIRGFSFGESVIVNGVEYWFEPDKPACANALGLPWMEIGSFGAAKSIVNFYDYHASVGSDDVKKRFLDVLDIVSTEQTIDGLRTIIWKNCCTTSLEDVRRGLYDYLETYVWPLKCSEIVDLIDGYVRRVALSEEEIYLHDIIIGRDYFNDLFYLTAVEVACTLLTDELINSIVDSIPNKNYELAKHSRPQNALITQLDEAKRLIFRTNLDDGQFTREHYSRLERAWHCSPDDLRLRILPLVLFISNWSIVLGSYLTVRNFGSLALSVGE